MDSKPSYEALLEKINQLETENLRLRSEAVKYRTLFDAFPHGISVSNEQGDILETNDIAEKLLGVGKQDHEGRAIDGQEWRIVRPDGTDLPPSQWASVIALKENTLVSNSEIGIVKPDGTTVWLNVTAAPLSLPGHGVVITYSDITARKIMENEQKTTQHELLKRNQFIEAILDHMPIGLGLNDIDTGEVTYLNKKWEEIYGWGKDAFPTVLDFFEKVFPDPTVRSTLQARIMNDIASGDPDRMIWEDLEIATAQGDKRIVHARNIPLVEQNLMISTVQDVTEKRKLQAQLHQAQKLEAVGTLAGGIAHDFNNLLGVIIGNISYALGLVDTSDELYDVLSEVQGVSKQAQGLTHQLLTFSKGGAPVKKISDVNGLLEKAAVFSVRGTMVRCVFDLAKNLWAAEIDEGQIRQVVGNVLINAHQAMPNGGTVAICTENVTVGSRSELPLPPGTYIKIVVKDQGVGISKEHLPHIFDPYFTTKQKGSGLGLAITYSIIHRHGGHIEAASTHGEGTAFTIYLPALSPPQAASGVEKGSGHKGMGKILVMDDQESILRMVTRILNRMGYETASAMDGQEAVDMYHKAYQSKDPFDLVILDLTIPGGMGGAQTIPALLKIDPNVKAVVSSGYSNDPIMADYKAYGFCGIIPKPYSKEQMAALLGRLLGPEAEA